MPRPSKSSIRRGCLMNSRPCPSILFLKRRTHQRSCKYGRTAHRRDGGLWFGTSDARRCFRCNLDAACSILARARPTAVNLQWAIDSMRGHLLTLPSAQRARPALPMPARWRTRCRPLPAIGEQWAPLDPSRRRKQARPPSQYPDPLQRGLAGNGRLAAPATAPIYMAHERRDCPACVGG